MNAARLSPRRERSAFLPCRTRGPSSPTSLRPGPGWVSPWGASPPLGTRQRLGALVLWDGHCGGGCLGTQQEEPLPLPDVSFASLTDTGDSEIGAASRCESYPPFQEHFPSFNLAFLPLLCRVTVSQCIPYPVEYCEIYLNNVTFATLLLSEPSNENYLY